MQRWAHVAQTNSNNLPRTQASESTKKGAMEINKLNIRFLQDIRRYQVKTEEQVQPDHQDQLIVCAGQQE